VQRLCGMKSKLWLVNLGFIPRSFDLALLFLRIALGVSMIVLHGWAKLTGFADVVAKFPDPLGIGQPASLVLAVSAEILCSAMLVIGALTRFAAAVLAINMSVALFIVHHGDMTRAGGGEPAALYLFGYATILLAGGGRFSADGAGGPWALAAFGAVAGVCIGYPFSYCFQPADHGATASLGDYLANFRSVLADDTLKTTALLVWISTVIVLSVAGYFIGRAMHRSRTRVASVETPPPSPPRD